MLVWCSLSTANAQEMIYQTYLNEVDRGTLFVVEQHNSIYLTQADVDSFELEYDQELLETFNGLDYLSLNDLNGISHRVDMALLELHLTAQPELLPLQTIDLSTRIQKKVLYPENDSFFLNYGATYRSSESLLEDEWQLSFEAGYRKGQGLFLTDGFYSHAFEQDEFVRLQTTYVRDDRQRLKRYIYGDQLTHGSIFAGRIRLGGMGISRNFTMNPYAISYPTVNISGLVERPSEVKVYLDDQQLSTSRVEPGRFELVNLNRYGGAGEVKLLIRDAYGREEQLLYPFYISDHLLKVKDQTYSYHLGMKRQQYGQESFEYADAIFSGYHLYGLTDHISAGGTAELSSELSRLAPSAIYKLGHYGVLQTMLAVSTGSELGDGYAGALLYEYRKNNINVGLQLQTLSEEYSTLADIEATNRRATILGARGGFSMRSFGSLSYDYLNTAYYGEVDSSQIHSLTYNRPLGKSVSLFALMRKESGGTDESTMFVNISWTPLPNHQASVRSESLSDGRRNAASFSKNTPTGRGYGYRVSLEQDSTDGGEDMADLAGDYHGRYGNLSVGIDSYSGDNSRTDYDIQAGGALVWIGQRWRATRPVRDSFALVKIGDIENVRVYRNAEQVARTDNKGEAIVPGLMAFYHNRITFDDRDVPLEYQFAEKGRYISPPYRSGSCLGFAVNKISPVIGKLFFVYEGEAIPLEFREVVVEDNAQEIIIETGRGGEFYLDRSSPDKVQVETRCDRLFGIDSESGRTDQLKFVYTVHDQPFERVVDLPKSETFFMEVGDIMLIDRSAGETE